MLDWRQWVTSDKCCHDPMRLSFANQGTRHVLDVNIHKPLDICQSLLQLNRGGTGDQGYQETEAQSCNQCAYGLPANVCAILWTTDSYLHHSLRFSRWLAYVAGKRQVCHRDALHHHSYITQVVLLILVVIGVEITFRAHFLSFRNCKHFVRRKANSSFLFQFQLRIRPYCKTSLQSSDALNWEQCSMCCFVSDLYVSKCKHFQNWPSCRNLADRVKYWPSVNIALIGLRVPKDTINRCKKFILQVIHVHPSSINLSPLADLLCRTKILYHL